MLRFKYNLIEERLQERKNHLTPHTFQVIRKVVHEGAEGINPNTLSNLSSDLGCLPSDIIEYV